MKKLVVALSALLLLLPLSGASAQWQVPDHAVPIGNGAGVTGFNSAAPGTSGQCLKSNGTGADPSFQACSVAAVDTTITPASTALNTAIGALPATGGTVDARPFGCTTQTIAATVNVGSATKQVKLLVDACTNFEITITNGTDAFILGNNSAIVAEGMGPQTGSITFHVGGSAVLSSVITNSDKTAGNYGLAVRGVTIGGSTTGTVSNGLLWLKGLHGINSFSDMLIENVQNTAGLLIQNGAAGLATGTINFYNIWVDGGALVGGRPVEITDLSGGGIFAGINFFGGALEHPGTGQAIVRITSQFNNVKSIGFYGIYSETSNANNKVMVIDGGENIWVNGWQASGTVATNCFQLTNATGGTTQGVILQSVRASSCTNTIQDSINSVNHGDTHISQFIFGATGTDITQVYINGGQISKQSSGAVTNGGVVMAGGTVALPGTGSGSATITAQATAGTPTLTLPNTSGTFAIGAGASSPLSVSATTGALGFSGMTSNGILAASSATAVVTDRCTMDSTSSITCNTASSFKPNFVMGNTTNDAGGPSIIWNKNRAGGDTLNGDNLLVFQANGFASAAAQASATIQVNQAAASSGANIPSTLAFKVSNSAGQVNQTLSFTNKAHLNVTASVAPTLTAGCNGAGTVVTGSNAHGTATGQTAAATTCTLTFANSGFGATPDCVVSGLTSPLTGAITPSTTTLVVNFASTANYKFSWHCFGM